MFFFMVSKFAKIAPVHAIVCRINQDWLTVYGKMQPGWRRGTGITRTKKAPLQAGLLHSMKQKFTLDG
jgi:hypothetical protein